MPLDEAIRLAANNRPNEPRCEFCGIGHSLSKLKSHGPRWPREVVICHRHRAHLRARAIIGAVVLGAIAVPLFAGRFLLRLGMLPESVFRAIPFPKGNLDTIFFVAIPVLLAATGYWMWMSARDVKPGRFAAR